MREKIPNTGERETQFRIRPGPDLGGDGMVRKEMGADHAPLLLAPQSLVIGQARLRTREEIWVTPALQNSVGYLVINSCMAFSPMTSRTSVRLVIN